MADLDHFKNINDTYGHLTGDYVLRETALRLRSNIRTYDAIGRYGGEEFLVVLPGCDGSGGLAQAERLRESIGGERIATPAGQIPVTCSVGLSWCVHVDPACTKQLLRSADAALYGAKAAGRNRVAVRSPDLAAPEFQLVQ